MIQNHRSMAPHSRAGRHPAVRILFLVAALAWLQPAGARAAERPPTPAKPPAAAQQPAPLPAPGAAGSAQPGSPQPGAPLPPQARVRVQMNQLLQLHHWLMATCNAPRRPDYTQACEVYRGLQEGATSPAVWQFVNDACALASDIAELTARADRMPAAMSAKETADARRLVGALAGAWPVYEKNDLIELNRSLQRITMVELRQRFQMAIEPRVMPTLYEKMMLHPPDGPITVFPVTHSTHLGDWGRTTKGYYLIQPMVGQRVSESLVHELTHLLESGQPAGDRTLLRRLQEAARAIPPADFEPFAEGLVVYNAREILERVTGREGTRPYPPSIAAWVPVYEKAWNPYLEGTAGADETVSRLVAGFLAQGRSTTPAKP